MRWQQLMDVEQEPRTARPVGGRAGRAGGSTMTGCWTPSVDTAVRLDYEHGGRRLAELADRLRRTEAAVGQRASKLGLERVKGRR